MAEFQGSNVTIMVTDMDAAIKFYVDILGFDLKNRFGNHWADVEGPGINIGLHPSQKEIIRGGNIQLGLRVKDLNQTVSELEKKGIVFKITEDEKVQLASFKDPDGNILYLAQFYT